MVDKVGFLITTTPGDWQDYIASFTDVWVRILGHPNNSIKTLPSGGAHGDPQKVVQAARDFQADSDVKVIVTAGTGAALTCKAELTKPFVYAAIGDPTLSHLLPGVDGTNFTGGNNLQADQAAVQARVDWMLNHGFKEPFAVLGNNANGNEPIATAMSRAYNYLHSLGHVVQSQTVTPQNDIPTVISALKAQTPPIKSIYVCSDPYLTVMSKDLNDAAHDIIHGSPYINTMFEIKEHVNKHGGNAWYGSDFEYLFGQAAYYADEIMTGTKTPAELPNYTSTLSGGGAAHASRKKSKKKSTKKKSAKKKSAKKKSVKKRSGKKKSTRKKK
jgi:ABC-type uncharacterized transport system substrate-binding protein